MKKYIQKVTLSFLTLLVLSFSVFTPQAQAQLVNPSTWYNAQPGEWYLKVYDNKNPSEIFGERYTAAQVQWILYAIPYTFINTLLLNGRTEVMVCLLSGDIPSCAQTFLDALKGLVDAINPLTDASNNPSPLAIFGSSPISGIGYTKNLIKKFNPVSEAQAQTQGFGFSTGANAVVKLWQASRNIAYGLLVLAIIIMAFMVMFRVKISPQVVITVQSAIPKIISALILITFSYAIAGFVIDLMYVVIGLLVSAIIGQGLSSHTFIELFRSFTTGENAIGLLFKYWLAFVITAFSAIFSSINPMTWIGGVLLLLFAILTVLVMIVFTFRILALIFRNFAMIILTIITGPFEILFGVLTNGAGFGPWIRKLISYLAVYPVIGLLFFLAFFFLAQSLGMGLGGGIMNLLGGQFVSLFPFNPAINVISGNTWDPPLSTFLVSGDALLWAIVSFVIITLIPRTAEIIQGVISGRPFAAGTAIGEAVGPIRGVWGGTAGVLTGGAQRAFGASLDEAYGPVLRGLLTRLNPTNRRRRLVPEGENLS